MLSSNLNDSIRALAQDGVDAAAIAENFGLSEAEVLSVLAAKRATRSAEVLRKIESLGDDAVRVIADVMNDSEVHPVVRLKAAQYVSDVAAGLRTPTTHVLPDTPVGLADTFKKWMDTYTDTMRRAQETPKPTTYKQIIDVQSAP